MNLFKNTLNILDELKDKKYHSSIIFSYSFDLMFYERFILSALRSSGCKNNIVAVDANQYQNSLELSYSSHSLIGKFYSVIPCHCEKSFHPKIICLFGDNNIKFLIGSGNLNLGGYSKNFEAFFKIEINEGNPQLFPLAQSIWNFIKNTVQTNDSLFTYRQLRNIEQEYGFLSDFKLYNSNSKLEDVPAFLFHKERESILDQFLYRINTKIKQLVIISPFFDKDSSTLKLMLKEIKPDRCDIILQDDSVSINKSSFPKDNNIHFYNISNSNNKHYLHAKVYIAVGNNISHILIGSSNCTRSGLGELHRNSGNIEASIYYTSADPKYWLHELELDKILSENKISFKDCNFKFHSSEYNSKNEGINLISADFIEGNYIVLLDSILENIKYEMILLNENINEICTISNFKVYEENLVFNNPNSLQEPAPLCLIKGLKNIKSNLVAINYQRELIQNSPRPSLSYLYEIINEYSTSGNKELGDIIEPFRKLIDHELNTISKAGYSSYRYKNEVPASEDINSVPLEKISYEEFLKKEQKQENKIKDTLFSERTDLGFLIRFLLSRIGLVSHAELNKDNLESDTHDETIYDEETSEEDLVNRPDGYYKVARKEHVKIIKRSEAKYYKQGIKHLSNRFLEYLDYFIKGNEENKIQPPRHINEVIIFQYLSVMMLINYFAGREYKIEGNVEEILSIDENIQGYWSYTLEIIGKYYCVMNGRRNIPTIYERTHLSKEIIFDNEDLKSVIYLTLFNLSVLHYLSSEENKMFVEATFVKMFINCKLQEIHLNKDEIKKYFKRYFSDSGYYSKRNSLTMRKIISTDNILTSFSQLSEITLKVDKSLKIKKDSYENGKGRFTPLMKKGQWVWFPNIGITIIEEVKSSQKIKLYSYGNKPSNGLPDQSEVLASYVMPIF